MKNVVKVVLQPGKSGVITPFALSSDGIQRGSIMLESSEIKITNGFATKSKRTAFINGDVEVLKELGLVVGQELEGRIVVEEATTPFYEGQPAKINPSTNVVVLHEGKPIYRKSTFVTDDISVDKLLSNDVAITVFPKTVKEQGSTALPVA